MFAQILDLNRSAHRTAANLMPLRPPIDGLQLLRFLFPSSKLGRAPAASTCTPGGAPVDRIPTALQTRSSEGRYTLGSASQAINVDPLCLLFYLTNLIRDSSEALPAALEPP